MEFRKATFADIEKICEIYDNIHTAEEVGRVYIGWERDVYPTKDTAVTSVSLGDNYLCIDEEKIVATGRINQEQVPEYYEVDWMHEAADSEVMVLHTLAVDPEYMGRGYGSSYAGFYEDFAREKGCRVLRIDTNEKNFVARKMYEKLGYREAATMPCVFNIS